MQKFLFGLAFLALFSCGFADKAVTNPSLHTLSDELIPSLNSIHAYQLAWNKAHANSILWVNQHGETESKMQLKRFVA
ncbi:MAG: hypothetical protein M3R17_04845 [Bacteroidota bacterium]|nr:hypothetical protein [Bacteroidota bacterium]